MGGGTLLIKGPLVARAKTGLNKKLKTFGGAPLDVHFLRANETGKINVSRVVSLIIPCS